MRIDRRSLLAATVAIAALGRTARAQEAQPDPPWILLANGQPTDPLGRWGHTLVIDTWHNRLVLVGGRDALGTVKGDLWTFDLGSWTWSELDLSGPKARSDSASAIAADGSGFYYAGGASDDAVFDDLWWFDFASTTWRQIETNGPGPGARMGSRGAIDVFGRFVITHGRNGSSLFDDTWAFDAASGSWSELSSGGLKPIARFDHDLVALPDYGVLLMGYGASNPDGAGRLGDLWSYDMYNDFWAEVTPTSGPSARTGAAMSKLGNSVLLVGGSSDLGLQSDVWTGDLFDGFFKWTELTPVNHGPLGIYRRAWHDMTAANGEYYVFGGYGAEGALSDLWKFSPERIEHPGEDSEYIEPSDIYEEE